ncbi:MAG: hypothetical protein FJ150_07785 [Euryarchaeota archaeon]|nr:hypothetical protein [Euryarchaeota archaeon]
MNNNELDFGNYWNGKEVRLTRSASYELMIESIDHYSLIQGLNDGEKCPKSRRRQEKFDWCVEINGKEYKVTIVASVTVDFELKPCWLVIHIKPYNWKIT